MSASGYFIDWSQLTSGLEFNQGKGVQPASASRRSPLSNCSFTELLAPLKRGVCQEAIHQVKLQLQVVNQTLSLLDGQAFEVILQEMLDAFTLKVGEILNADRTTVFLADKTRQELWSTVVDRNSPQHPVEIRLPWHQGIAGEVARTQRAVNVPFDFYTDARSTAAKSLEAKTGYRTYTLLALPVLDSEGDLLAVVELLNKCHAQNSPELPLRQRIDPDGFGSEDEVTFGQFADVFQLILESSRAFYLAARRQKAAAVLSKATQALNHSGLTLDNTLQWVMKEAQHLLNADRSAVWLLNQDRSALWANIPLANGITEEVSIAHGQGYVGQVAATGTVLNIPHDLYQHPDSQTARSIDQLSGYRTYSLLCMPVFDSKGQLIAVTQLINKYRANLSQTDAATGVPHQPVPACFQTSFTTDDEFYMLAFNIHAGAAIERALLYESLEAKVTERTKELQAKNQQLQHEIQERIKVEAALSDLNQQLKEMAQVDALTQVANRRQFEHHIEQEWRRMRRAQMPLSVILCDIDFFKRYNDRYGHPAGDECLRQVATAMKQQVKRSGDLFARYGGEEFVVVLPNTGAEGALHVAETLRQEVLKLSLPHEDSTVSDIVTLSLGVATDIPQPALTTADLIKQADEALYHAKENGRNQTIVWAKF